MVDLLFDYHHDTMLYCIVNNPFRTLGIFANSSSRRIVESAETLLKDPFAIMDTDWSIAGLPRPIRDKKSILAARDVLVNDKSAAKYKFFWFMNGGSPDGLKDLEHGDLQNAFFSFLNDKEGYGRHNWHVADLMLGKDLSLAVSRYLKTIKDEKYRKTIIKNSESLSNVLVDFKSALFEAGPSFNSLDSETVSDSSRFELKTCIRDGLISRVNSALSKAENQTTPSQVTSYFDSLRTISTSGDDLYALSTLINNADQKLIDLNRHVFKNTLGCIENILISSTDPFKYLYLSRSFFPISNSLVLPAEKEYLNTLLFNLSDVARFDMSADLFDAANHIGKELLSFSTTRKKASIEHCNELIDNLKPTFNFLANKGADKIYKRSIQHLTRLFQPVIKSFLSSNSDWKNSYEIRRLISSYEQLLDVTFIPSQFRGEVINSLFFENTKPSPDKSKSQIQPLSAPSPNHNAPVKTERYENKKRTKGIILLLIASFALLCGTIILIVNIAGTDASTKQTDSDDYSRVMASHANRALSSTNAAFIIDYLRSNTDDQYYAKVVSHLEDVITQQIDSRTADIKTLKEFLTMVPDGPLTSKVVGFIEKNEKQLERPTAQDEEADESDYKKAFKTYTISSLSNYLKEHPNGKYVEYAKLEIEAIRSGKNGKSNDNSYNSATSAYAGNYLRTGTQPYANIYGRNYTGDGYPVEVIASQNEDVVVIVKSTNRVGRVVGHAYIRMGHRYTITLKDAGTYQVFFYHGKDWNPQKQLSGNRVGGFDSHEQYGSAPPFSAHIKGNQYVGMLYDLNTRRNGNFHMGKCNEGDVF